MKSGMVNPKDKRYGCLVLVLLFVVSWGGFPLGIALAWNGAGPDFGDLRDELGLEDKVEGARQVVVKPSLSGKKERPETIKIVPSVDLEEFRKDVQKKSGNHNSYRFTCSQNKLNFSGNGINGQGVVSLTC